jgi:hypothetical protein
MKKHLKLMLALMLAVLFLNCADQVTFEQAKSIDPVGFWHGLWHGLTCGFSFWVSLFSDNVSIYAIYNNGGWYNFGFVLGAGILFKTGSSINLSSKRR